MPNANRLTVGIMAMVAQEERRMISERTKAALAAAKARGVKLGNYWKNPILPPDAGKLGNAAMKRKADARAAGDIAPIIAELQAGGATSLRAIAAGLNERGVPTHPEAASGQQRRSCAFWRGGKPAPALST
jgi:DNA invertase Pin-like site-specific DNA recombinase